MTFQTPIKKLIYVMFGIAMILIIAIIIIKPSVADKWILLENKYPGYVETFLSANNYLGNVDNASYRLVNAEKDGFGNVQPKDLEMFIRSSKYMYPTDWITICFDDGTGIQIKDTSAVYGRVDNNGIVVGKSKGVNLFQPVINQITGVTRINRICDRNGNVIYEFRVDSEGIGIADDSGVAGYIMEFEYNHTEI